MITIKKKQSTSLSNLFAVMHVCIQCLILNLVIFSFEIKRCHAEKYFIVHVFVMNSRLTFSVRALGSPYPRTSDNVKSAAARAPFLLDTLVSMPPHRRQNAATYRQL